MHSLIVKAEQGLPQKNLPHVSSGDIVKVYQRIREGGKQRSQMFEGLVIAVKRQNSANYSITVRRISSGVGVEKSFRLNSPNIEKVVVIKRSRARRNKLNFMRQRQGKAARLGGVYAAQEDLAEQETQQVMAEDKKTEAVDEETTADEGKTETEAVETDEAADQDAGLEEKDKT